MRELRAFASGLARRAIPVEGGSAAPSTLRALINSGIITSRPYFPSTENASSTLPGMPP